MSGRLSKIDFFDNLGVRRDVEEDPVLNYEQKVRRHQIANLLEAEGGYVLDAGRGSGRDTLYMILTASGGEYVGVDISAQSLREALMKSSKLKKHFNAIDHFPMKEHVELGYAESFEKDDPGELVKAIEKALDRYEKMSIRGHEIAKRLYHPVIVANRILKLLELL